jgi:hypothetical protein
LHSERPILGKEFHNDGNVVGKREFLRFCMSDETYMLGFMGGGNGATWHQEDYATMHDLGP